MGGLSVTVLLLIPIYLIDIALFLIHTCLMKIHLSSLVNSLLDRGGEKSISFSRSVDCPVNRAGSNVIV